LLTFSDNVRQLEALATEAVVEQEVAQRLTAIYLAFRQRLHRLALIGAEGVIGDEELSEERGFVASCWDSVFGAGSTAG
jgi:glutamate-ammonia-ligase adenylyltransferase